MQPTAMEPGWQLSCATAACSGHTFGEGMAGLCYGVPIRDGNDPSRSLKFHNYGEGPYYGLLLVESGYY